MKYVENPNLLSLDSPRFLDQLLITKQNFLKNVFFFQSFRLFYGIVFAFLYRSSKNLDYGIIHIMTSDFFQRYFSKFLGTVEEEKTKA